MDKFLQIEKIDLESPVMDRKKHDAHHPSQPPAAKFWCDFQTSLFRPIWTLIYLAQTNGLDDSEVNNQRRVSATSHR